jgi:tape measure domain-containing protein
MDNQRVLEIILRARDEASQTIKQVGDSTAGLTGLVKKHYAAAAVASGALIGSLGAITAAAVSNAASYEQNRIAFDSMLGGFGKGRDLLQQVAKFAKDTPFDLPQVVEGSKRLLAYNIEAKKIIPTFKMLGDIAGGVGTDKLPQLITAFGQVQAKGRLMGTELLQFTEAGVGLGQQLQKQFGVTREELEKMISSGRVTADDVTRSLQAMTSKGGLFFDGMKTQSQSFNGVMNNIRETFAKLAREIIGINENGGIRQGSIFFYLKEGATLLLPVLEAALPKIAAVVDMLVSNKEVVIAVAGAIGGLLVLAIGAAVVAFGPILAVMAAVAAVGATVALAAYRIASAFQEILPLIAAAWQGIVQTVQTKANEIFLAFKAAFDRIPPLVKQILGTIALEILKFNPIIRIGLELPDIIGKFGGLKEQARKLGIPGFAGGTDFAPGGLAMVGERGPELVNLPRGSQVIPNDQTQRLMGGATIQIAQVVIRQDSDIETLARRLDFYRRTGGNA